MIDPEKEEEQRQISLYEIIRNEEDRPFPVAEAVTDYTPCSPSSSDNLSCKETDTKKKFDEHGFYKHDRQR